MGRRTCISDGSATFRCSTTMGRRWSESSQRDLFRGVPAQVLGYGQNAQRKMLDALLVKDVTTTDKIHWSGRTWADCETKREMRPMVYDRNERLACWLRSREGEP